MRPTRSQMRAMRTPRPRYQEHTARGLSIVATEDAVSLLGEIAISPGSTLSARLHPLEVELGSSPPPPAPPPPAAAAALLPPPALLPVLLRPLRGTATAEAALAPLLVERGAKPFPDQTRAPSNQTRAPCNQTWALSHQTRA